MIPASYQLYGTNAAISSTANSTGTAESWTLIQQGSLSLPSARLTTAAAVPVTNSVSYTSYKVIFDTVKSPIDAMQIADIQFFGAPTNADITLTSLTGSIIDAPDTRDDVLGDSADDAVGNNITLAAFGGAIGTKDNVFEINSSSSAAGVLTASATRDIFITESTGDLDVNTVGSTLGDVRLVTVGGGIFDANNNAAVNVSGVSIDVETNTGTSTGIGASSNPLEINSSNSGIGRLYAVTGDGIFITETAGELNVLRAESSFGDVVLTVVDSAATGNDLNVIETGMDFSAAMATHSGSISSPGSVTLTVGDDRHQRTRRRHGRVG